MFFTAINQMMTEGVDLTIVIRKANGQMAVSTLPKSNGLKDEAQNHIVPLTVSGLPEELDAGFLQTVARPIQKVAGLITNMAQFEAQADKAAADSKAAKEEKAKETKEEKEKREKYEKHLKKAEELIAAGKHSEGTTEWLFIERSPYITIPTANPFVVIPATVIPKTVILIENKNVFLFHKVDYRINAVG